MAMKARVWSQLIALWPPLEVLYNEFEQCAVLNLGFSQSHLINISLALSYSLETQIGV